MKKLSLVAVLIAITALVAAPMNAQGKIALNIGGDVLIPMGGFGDFASVGFGGDVIGEYALMPELSLTASLGYLTWGGKDYTVLGQTISGPSFHGVPFLVGAKYYFMPKGNSARFYAAGQIGLFFGSYSVDIPSYSYGGFTFGGGSESFSSTNFTLAPIVGVELPVGTGTLDGSVRYFLITGGGPAGTDVNGTSSSGSAGSIGFRVGYKFPIGS